MLWSSVYQAVICMALLWSHMGASVFAGLAVIILLIPLNGFVAGRLRARQKKLMECKDERVSLTTEVLVCLCIQYCSVCLCVCVF